MVDHAVITDYATHDLNLKNRDFSGTDPYTQAMITENLRSLKLEFNKIDLAISLTSVLQARQICIYYFNGENLGKAEQQCLLSIDKRPFEFRRAHLTLTKHELQP